MKRKILNRITANIGVIIIFTIVLIIFAPSFFSGNTFAWLENCFLFRNINFTQTGNIGDTIGGISAPFIGVLSIILLCITFREQREFNKTQRSANDWAVLLEMKNTIGNHSKNVQFDLIFPVNQSRNNLCIGLDRIESLNSLTNNGGQISLDDFNKLYDEIMLIADLCILFYEINNKSSLSDEIKKSFKNTIWHYSKKAGRFFVLCSQDRVSVIQTMHTMHTNPDTPTPNSPIQDKTKVTEKYIQRLRDYI